MLVTCEKCAAKYNIADDKIKATGTAVRCPKCQHVFKVFSGGGGGAETVACANCGKQTPAVEGQAVVFCGDCRDKIADAPAGGDETEKLFASGSLFGGGSPAPSGGLFDDAPAPSSGGGLFDDAPAPSSGGGLFDDAPAPAPAPASASGGGGMFDDEPKAPSGGGLFGDEPAPDLGGNLFGDEPAAAPKSAGSMFDDAGTAPAADGGLFDDTPADTSGNSGGGLFDDEPAAGGGLFDDDAPAAPAAATSADPFGDFDSAPGQGDGAAADPFGDFAEPPQDDFAPAPEGADTASQGMESDEADADSAPVRVKEAPKFKQKEVTGKDKALEMLSAYGPKIGIIGGGGIVVVGILLLVAMAALPKSFGARPTRAEDHPGLLSRTSFSLQKSLKTKFYGQAMEQSFLTAASRVMSVWSGKGFAAAEKEYRELLAFDPTNAAAKSGLLNALAMWDAIEENTNHKAEIESLSGATNDAKISALAAVALNKQASIAALLPKLGDQADLFSGWAKSATGDTEAGLPALKSFAASHKDDVLGQFFLGAALRNAGQSAEAVSAYTQVDALLRGNAKAALEIGKLYFARADGEENAAKNFQRVLTPELGASSFLSAEAQFYMASILHRRGKGPEAMTAIQAALAIEGSNPRYLSMLGGFYYDSGKIVDAYQSYDKARLADPKFVEAYIGLGRSNERLEKVPQAIENYTQAIAIGPNNMQANVLYANLILRQGNKAEAEKVLTKVLESDPGNIDALGYLAKFYIDQLRFEDALKQYQRIIELAPGNLGGYLGRGAVLIELKNVSEAKLMFQKAATIDTNNPTVLFRLGQAAYLEGDIKIATESLQSAVMKDPYHWEAHLYLGMTLLKLNEYDGALKEFKKTTDVNMTAAEAYRQRGLVYLAQGRLAEKKAATVLFEKAVAELEQAMYHGPNNPDYYYDYGMCLDALGLKGKAKDAWLKAKELRPGFKEAMFRLALYYVDFNDYQNAENTLKEVLKSSPKNAQAYYGMGRVYWNKNQMDEAQRAFAKAVQLDPKYADAFNGLGEVYDRKEMPRDANLQYQKALQADPKHGLALFNLGLYFKDRDKAASKDYFKRSFDSKTLDPIKAEEVQVQLRELEYVK